MGKEYKTFDDWNNEGYRVKKGEKCKWINGKAMFSLNQVNPMFEDFSRIRKRKRKNMGDWALGLDHDDMRDYTGNDYL